MLGMIIMPLKRFGTARINSRPDTAGVFSESCTDTGSAQNL
jgi:hypothetical protein